MPLYLPVLLPILLGALLPLILPRVGKRVRGILILLPVLADSVLVWMLILSRNARSDTLMTVTWNLALCFRLDGPACVFAGLIAFLWPLATLYGFEYMEHEERTVSFFTFYVMAYGITLGIAMAANLFTLYVFYECLTLITLPLVAHKQNSASVHAARSYLYYSIGGAALAFVAMMLTMNGGTSSMFRLGGNLSVSQKASLGSLLPFIVLLAFFGFGVKAAVFPLSAWLPTVSVAPTPVTALLHAVAVVNAGAYACIRFLWYVLGPNLVRGTWAWPVILVLSCFTVVFASCMAVRERHLKRRLAWSTVSNLSYMLAGCCLLTPEGLTGSLTHLVCHGVMKMGLFLCAGAILVQSKKEYVRDLNGFGKKMPLTCAFFTFGAVAMTGIPPLCGFVSKWQLLTASASVDGILGILPIVSLIISSILTAIYLFTVSATMYFRPASDLSASDPGWRMILPLAVLAAACALGLCSSPLIRFLDAIATGTIL